MPKKPADLILKILKDAGVELETEIVDTVKNEIDEQITLEATGETLGDGEIAVKEDSYKKTKADLVTLRKRMHTAETRTEELEATMAAGESSLKNENINLKDKLGKLEPLHERLLKREGERWDGIKEQIPEKLQAELHWAKDDKEKLTNEQIIENLGNVDKWKKLGVPGLEAGEGDDKESPPSLPIGSLTGKVPKGGADDLAGLNTSQLMEEGYKTVTKSSVDRK